MTAAYLARYGAAGEPRCSQRRPGYQASTPGVAWPPCARPLDHAGPHMDVTGETWSTTIDVADLDPHQMNIVDSADGRHVHIVLGDARVIVPTTGDGADLAAEAMWRLSELAHEAAHRAAWRVAARATRPRSPR
ncbi:hypothetical protein HNR23_005075 [Nocardiopsis mwathae]|uniref:Uncharacterized protein n=1 Tax=Nocardiopsis mwathae TaxID=1472723 RepID=A0A7W9YMQ2_9ACTN|nr:hypothetical protein [Nocardiopsis mwathae]MBB6175015.1 hypothetical protein [Nocardiopsis mwathae]